MRICLKRQTLGLSYSCNSTSIWNLIYHKNCRYTGTEGIYLRTVPHDKDPNCIICSPGVPLEVDKSITLQKVHKNLPYPSQFNCLLNWKWLVKDMSNPCLLCFSYPFCCIYHPIICGLFTHLCTYAEPSLCFLQFIDTLFKDRRFKLKLSKPSVSYHGNNLYMQAPPVLEEMTRPNLQEPLVRLMGGEKSDVLNINDRRLTGVLRVRVTFRDDAETIDMDTVGTHWLNFWSVLESTKVSVFIITTPLRY